MTTVRIDDLNHSKDLDAGEMAAVSGSGAVETIINTAATVASTAVDMAALGIGLLTDPCGTGVNTAQR